MSRSPVLVALVLVAGACTNASTPTTTTSTAPATTTTTISPRQGMVPSPAAILNASQNREIDRLVGDTYLAYAMFSQPDLVPIEYLAPAPEVEDGQWDHSFLTRLVGDWDELGGEDQAELLNAVDGLAELLEARGVRGIPSTGGDEACIPASSGDVLICVGESISQNAGLVLDETVVAVRLWVRGAVEDAWPRFEGLFGEEPDTVKVFLSDLTTSGGYGYSAALSPDEPATCHVYIDISSPGSTDLPRLADVQAASVHELFHCFQQAALSDFDASLWEGSATWSQHYVYPEENTELPWMTTWVSDPDRPFSTRLYDVSFGFLYAELRGAGPSAVIDVLSANSIASLDDDFESLWHQISLAAWNRSPVDPLLNDGAASIPAAVTELGITEVAAESEGSLPFSLPLYSRDIQTLQFSGSTATAGLIDFARLSLDLSQVPDDVRLSALTETAQGWFGPVALTGDEWQFCRRATGPCNDADPEAILPYTRIALIATNVDNGVETFTIPWNTYNPRLDGAWVRTRGPISTVDTAPYWIVGTLLEFDEVMVRLAEDTGEFSLSNGDPRWACTFAGGYSITADPAYNSPDGGAVSGTVSVTGPAEGESFDNSCVLGDGPRVDGVHIPIAPGADDTFGFEIRGYDTLWIYAFERIYVYERAG